MDQLRWLIRIFKGGTAKCPVEYFEIGKLRSSVEIVWVPCSREMIGLLRRNEEESQLLIIRGLAKFLTPVTRRKVFVAGLLSFARTMEDYSILADR